jgi:hypothetical protein
VKKMLCRSINIGEEDDQLRAVLCAPCGVNTEEQGEWFTVTPKKKIYAKYGFFNPSCKYVFYIGSLSHTHRNQKGVLEFGLSSCSVWLCREMNR